MCVAAAPIRCLKGEEKWQHFLWGYLREAERALIPPFRP